MSTFSNHQPNIVKLLLLGDSKSGKTSSLVSLVEAGYHLRILDLDHLLYVLEGQILKRCPDNIANVEFRSLSDKYKPSPTGMVIDGKPKVWIDTLKMCDNWKYDDIDLGPPADWPDDCILVIDSLSRLCDGAYDFHEAIMPKGKSGDFDGRAVYGNAQGDVERFLALLNSPTFNVNVIVICHGIYQDNPDGTRKIYPQGVGQKLSPKIPQYFPNYIRYINKNDKREIQLVSDRMIDLANTRPDQLNKNLPTDTGLATIFSALRGQPPKQLASPSYQEALAVRGTDTDTDTVTDTPNASTTKPQTITLVRKPK